MGFSGDVLTLKSKSTRSKLLVSFESVDVLPLNSTGDENPTWKVDFVEASLQRRIMAWLDVGILKNRLFYCMSLATNRMHITGSDVTHGDVGA